MKEFEERLKSYFAEKDIEDENLQSVIKRCLGAPNGTVEEILEDVDAETQTYFYDAAFESVLDMYSNLFYEEEAAGIFESACGYYGTDTLFVTRDLQGVSVTTH